MRSEDPLQFFIRVLSEHEMTKQAAKKSPVPAVGPFETQDDFVQRCIHDTPAMKERFSSEKQRTAVCYTAFNASKKKLKPPETTETTIQDGARKQREMTKWLGEAQKQAAHPVSRAEEQAIQAGLKAPTGPTNPAAHVPNMFQHFQDRYGERVSPYQGLRGLLGRETDRIIQNTRRYRQQHPERLEGFMEGSLDWEDLLQKVPLRPLGADRDKNTTAIHQSPNFPLLPQEVRLSRKMTSRLAGDLTLAEELGHHRQEAMYPNPARKFFLDNLLGYPERPQTALPSLSPQSLQTSKIQPANIPWLTDYALRPPEISRKLARIRQIYQSENPEETVTTPEDFRRAWEWVSQNLMQHPRSAGYEASPLYKTGPRWWEKNAPETYQKLIEAGPGFVQRPTGRKHASWNTKSIRTVRSKIVQELEKGGSQLYKDAVLTKWAQDAPGLPSREDMGKLQKLIDLIGQMTPYVAQRHEAERAGPHYDFRIQTPEGLLSWALPKAQLPEKGTPRLAIRQPLHSTEYKKFEGEIPEGYGKGTVETAREGQLMITDVQRDEDDKIHEVDFSLGDKYPERFKLKKMRRTGEWLMINTTPTEAPEHTKRHFKKIEDPEKLDEMLEQVSPEKPVSAKIDGSLALLRFMKDGADVLSYRTSRRTGGPIIHTERVAPQLRRHREIPERLRGKTLEGELYAVGPEGKTLPSQEISGLLNQALGKSRREQEKRDAQFRMALFDVLPRDMPWEEKEELMQQAIDLYPQFLGRPPQAESAEEAQQLKEQVETGEHPLTEEGVVFTDGKPTKWKKGLETDVVIRGFTPGRGKHEGRVGAIRYSLTPEGKIVGQVGTGLSDKLRETLAENPEDFLDRVLRIRAQEQFPSGAFRAPRVLSLHEDYPHQGPEGTMEWGQDIQKRLHAGNR